MRNSIILYILFLFNFTSLIFSQANYDEIKASSMAQDEGYGYYGTYYLTTEETKRINRKHQNQLELFHLYDLTTGDRVKPPIVDQETNHNIKEKKLKKRGVHFHEVSTQY